MKHRGARNRKGRLLRSIRVGGRRQSYRQHAAARVLARAPAPTASTKAARARACCIRSNAARRRARARSRSTTTGRLVDEAVRFLQRRKPERARHVSAADGGGFREARIRASGREVSQPLVRRWRTSPPISRSIRKASKKPMFSPPHQDGGQTCVQVFFFRTGQNWGNRAYFPKADRSLTVDEVLDSFIAQFYDDKPVPRLILLSHDIPNRALLAEALSHQSRAQSRYPGSDTRRRNRASSNMRFPTPAKPWDASSPKVHRKLGCSKASPSASISPQRRAASRSSITATLAARMPSAP